MDQIKIGRFIAQMRKEKGLTQRELADQLEVSDKAVSKWECGKSMPDNALMMPLCAILGITVNELLSGEPLTTTDYSRKAEENIMSLIQETEKTKENSKRNSVVAAIGEVVLLVALLAYMYFITGLNSETIIYFLDYPAILVVAGTVLLLLMVTKSVGSFVKSFEIIFSKKCDADRQEIKDSLRAIKIAMQTANLAGILCALISGRVYLTQLEDISTLGPNLAVMMLSIFYGLLIVLLLIPVKSSLERRL